MTSRVLSSSLEDYIEAIYHLIAEKQTARVKDISKRLRVNYSSVTGALKALTKRNLVNYAPYEQVTLTTKGEEVAIDVIKRHEALRNFFVNVLAVDEKEADKVACKMEHVISTDILERIIQFADFVKTCPQGGAEWEKGIGYFCSQNKNREKSKHYHNTISKRKKTKTKKIQKKA